MQAKELSPNSQKTGDSYILCCNWCLSQVTLSIPLLRLPMLFFETLVGLKRNNRIEHPKQFVRLRVKKEVMTVNYLCSPLFIRYWDHLSSCRTPCFTGIIIDFKIIAIHTAQKNSQSRLNRLLPTCGKTFPSCCCHSKTHQSVQNTTCPKKKASQRTKQAWVYSPNVSLFSGWI